MSEEGKITHLSKETQQPATQPTAAAPGNKINKTANLSYTAKLEALDKLSCSFHELNDAVSKLKQSFQIYKTKSFFSPHPEFCKPFAESLKQIESGLHVMGNLFTKELSDKFTNRSDAAPVPDIVSTDFQPLNNHTPDHSEASGKTNGTASITPPASEAGNDDEVLLGSLYNTKSHNKRKCRISSESSAQESKKPRRSLIDDYLTKADLKETEVKRKNEEEEYEVQSIIDLKKMQGSCLYHVTWKGYGPEDSTWEPSSNLTGCEELLLEFYKSKFRSREKEDDKSEDLSQLIHYDPSTKKTIKKALFDSLTQPSKAEYQNAVTQLTSSKQTIFKTEEEIQELVEKAVTARKRDRYRGYLKMLQEDRMMKELKGKRDIQLAELRKWERSINTICSDPAKLCVENNVDLELPPMDFVYINESYEGEGVTIPSDPVVGCECEDCSTSKSCCASQMGSWVAYNKFGRLKISLGTPIYECNNRCKCGPNCVNRVVQHGRSVSLCIFRTPNGRGWGVKAMENIKKDSLVTEYVGEVISSEEAERRGKIYDAQKCTYLFDLDYNKGDQNPYTVDAAKCGNVSHFINHSCDPNLVVFNVWVNCLDPDLPRLALFATQDIRKGEELTFDYNSGLESEENLMKESNEDFTTPDKSKKSLPSEMFIKTPKGNRGLQYGKTKCRCGAANCRKYFF